jgi:hypothetical protein
VFDVPVSPAAVATPAVSPQAAPVADDLPDAGAHRDLESTWASRPEAPESPTAPKPEAANATPRPTPPAPAVPAASAALEVDDDALPEAPSYDYLFGHTTAVDEHRRVLAELTKVDQGDEHHDDHHDPHDDHDGGRSGEQLGRTGTPDPTAAAPAVADAAPAPVTNPVPGSPAAPAQPVPGTSGGLISAVPWATSSPAASAPSAPTEAPVDTPTFSGRHTPPPAPSLLPKVHTPPPGVRAPQASPLISTGPPPAAPAPAPTTPTAPTPPAAAAPVAPVTHEHPAPAVPPTQPIPTADPGHAVPHDTPKYEQHHTPRLAAATEELDDADEAEQTVDRSALLEARHAAQLANPTGPSVLAVLCASGHPTPPHGDACRVCGASIPPQEPFTMPRPPLGVLRLSTGDVVTLDRSVLLGRSPKLGEGVAATDRPHVVKVPSPERDVSRNHVEVVLEGWHVLVRDLGTTNGTTLALPGEAPVRLRANDQQVLEPGSVVSMADEVSFTFEAAL